jgi:hypothetical protein
MKPVQGSGTKCPFCHCPVGRWAETATHICPKCGGSFAYRVTKLYTAVPELAGDHPLPPDLSVFMEPGDQDEVIAAWELEHGMTWGGDRSYPFNRHHVYGDGALDPDWPSKVAEAKDGRGDLGERKGC